MTIDMLCPLAIIGESVGPREICAPCDHERCMLAIEVEHEDGSRCVHCGLVNGVLLSQSSKKINASFRVVDIEGER